MEQNKNEIDIANSEDNRDDSDGYQYHMIITILDKIKLQEQDLVHKARGKGSSKREWDKKVNGIIESKERMDKAKEKFKWKDRKKEKDISLSLLSSL